MSAVRTVGVVGAGTMGRGIAQVFAQAGFDVRVTDASAEARNQANDHIGRSVARLLEKGQISAEAAASVPSRLRIVPALDGFAEVDVAIEAVVEAEAIKADVLRQLASITPPETLLASNTSSISISRLGTASGRPARLVGMHFMNPVPLMPLVELVRGRETADASMALAASLCAALGKTAVESADSPGFISNRILMPMINEAAYALMEGVGTAEGIDTVMKLGMRHPMGPLAVADLIGLDVCVAILDVLQDGFGDAKYAPCPLLREMVGAGQLGRKTGRGFHRYG